MNKRIGFACKWIDNPAQVDGIKPTDDCKKYNTGTTTVAWLNRQTREVAEQKLWDLMKQNIESTRLLVQRVGELDNGLRMVRLSSDILPVYTESSWRYFWQLPDVQRYAEAAFAKVGGLARDRGVRLSFHPGQFTVLASDNPEIVEHSLEEFEYHATMAAWMGFAQQFQDFKINVHISGRAGPEGIRRAYQRLSPEARNTITIENEEISYGLNDCLSINDLVPIVLDIHHNWCREGSYIDPTCDRVKRVVDSWRGIRPVMHYSVSREDLLVGHPSDRLPDFKTLTESGHRRQHLRAHSDFYWNETVNRWALSFWDKFDIMCESKGKNLASFALHKYAASVTV
jgi:UV DNA damage repair endonuclease